MRVARSESTNTVKRVTQPGKIAFARKLRKEQTDAERLLWGWLRNQRLEGVRFRRQHPIGEFVADFVALDRRLIIELDGGHHNEDTRAEADGWRQEWLENEGYRVIRFWDNEVITNMEGVFKRIQESLNECHPHPDLLPSREKEETRTSGESRPIARLDH